METPANQPAEANQTDSTNDDLPKVDELTMLKSRAKMMGITFSNNIGLEALREKIRAKMEGEVALAGEVQAPAQVNALDPDAPVSGVQKKVTLRKYIQEREMKLIRLRITNLDPKKKDLPGEIFTVANRFLGTVRKYVPYGEVTDEGYHVPHCIYKMLKRRQFLSIRTSNRPGRTHQVQVESRWVNEFALEVLPPLTKEELGRLANAQAAAGVFAAA